MPETPETEQSADRLVEVLKEIRDELRAVRLDLGASGARMTSGVRTERVNRGGWRIPALAAGVAALALVLGLALRDRPAPQSTTVAAAPQSSAPSSDTLAKSEMPVLPAMPPRAVSPAQAPVVPPALAVAHGAVPIAKPLAAVPALATKPAERSPTGAPAVAAVPAPAKKRLRSDVAARPAGEVASDDDETMAFPPAPRRVRVHRLSYGPVGSEPAKL